MWGILKQNAMRELIFEVRIDENSETYFLVKALKPLEILNVLEFRSSGFLLLCRGSREDSEFFINSLSHDSRHVHVTILSKEKSGSEILLVSGKWIIADGKRKLDARRKQELKFFKAMEKAPIYSLGNPSFHEGTLRVSVIAREKMIKRLLDGLDEIRIPYKVLSLGRPKAGSGSVLNSLTGKQTSILRLAYVMGYYDVPKRVRTEDLATILRMNKGTVGEHLRRAEKHVFDGLLSRSS
jgi:hypothetical protein